MQEAIFWHVVWLRKDTALLDGSALTTALFIAYFRKSSCSRTLPPTKNGNVPFFLWGWVQPHIGCGNLCSNWKVLLFSLFVCFRFWHQSKFIIWGKRHLEETSLFKNEIQKSWHDTNYCHVLSRVGTQWNKHAVINFAVNTSNLVTSSLRITFLDRQWILRSCLFTPNMTLKWPSNSIPSN